MDGLEAVVLVGVVAGGVYLIDRYQRGQGGELTLRRGVKTTTTGPDFNGILEGFSGLMDSDKINSIGGIFRGGNVTFGNITGATSNATSNNMERAVMNLIGSTEAPQGYNQVYGGIATRDRPNQPLTTMTVQQVLDWQDSIDARYPSEAAGRYQVMEDTLRGLVTSGKVSASAIFNETTQDKIALILMERRGLRAYQSGKISLQAFGNRLAQEWASLPVLTGSKRGASYYAGDGLNHALVTPERLEAALGGEWV